MNMRKMSWSDWKKQMIKEMESDPMFASNTDVQPAKGLKFDWDKDDKQFVSTGTIDQKEH